MTMNVGRQIATLKRMTVTELRQKHIEAFGEPTGATPAATIGTSASSRSRPGWRSSERWKAEAQ